MTGEAHSGGECKFNFDASAPDATAGGPLGWPFNVGGGAVAPESGQDLFQRYDAKELKITDHFWATRFGGSVYKLRKMG